MPSKLKQRRLRRLKADLKWWRAEAGDLYARVMEQADELAHLRRQLATELGAPARIQTTSTTIAPPAICKLCAEGIRGGCSPCSFNQK